MVKNFMVVVFLFLGISFLKAEINVATAANMQATAIEIAEEFKKSTGITANIISGASGNLYQQIINDAPFNVFISADTFYPDELSQKNLTIDIPKIYAYGVLVIAMVNKNIKITEVEDLSNIHIKKVAIANPKVAPYGERAVSLLNTLNLYELFKDKLIYAPSITAVNQYIFSNSVDIAFTSKSSVIHSDITYYEIQQEDYSEIPQAMVLIKQSDSQKNDEAEQFFNFMLSPQAQDILKKDGYIIK